MADHIEHNSKDGVTEEKADLSANHADSTPAGILKSSSSEGEANNKEAVTIKTKRKCVVGTL